MRIAVVARRQEPFSIAAYTRHVLEHLADKGVEAVRFPKYEKPREPPANVDLVWDPGMAGNRRPPPALKRSNVPIVVTMHGAAPLTLPADQRSETGREAVMTRIANARLLNDWRWLHDVIGPVIAVSNYAAREITAVFPLDDSRVETVYHGVDHDTFRPPSEADEQRERPYFLHVSQHQPKKNTRRILAAYEGLDEATRPDLVLLSPGYRGDHPSTPGLRIIADRIDISDLVRLYQEALAFVFPSLHETFGLPILEAMACGTPVLTSNVTACPETAGDAALLVDPTSTGAVRAGMLRLATDADLRADLSHRGLERAAGFTWTRCAKAHERIFEAAFEEPAGHKVAHGIADALRALAGPLDVPHA